jgi:hypothetical protein
MGRCDANFGYFNLHPGCEKQAIFDNSNAGNSKNDSSYDSKIKKQ